MITNIMSRFLKLSKVIINKNVIQYIDINKDKFIIHLMSNKMVGTVCVMSNKMEGTLYNNVLNVCKTEHPIDYKTVDDWIDNEFK